MESGLYSARSLGELLCKEQISFSDEWYARQEDENKRKSKLTKDTENPFGKPIRKQVVNDLEAPFHMVSPCSIDLPGTDDIYFSGMTRASFAPESLEDWCEATSKVKLPPTEDGRYYFQPHSVYKVILDPIIRTEGLTGTVSTPSNLARATPLIRGVCPGVPEYNKVPPGYEGRIAAEVVTGDFGWWYRPGDALLQLRLATDEHQSSYQIDANGVQSLAMGLASQGYGLLNTPNGKPIPLEDLLIDYNGAVPIEINLHPDAEIYASKKGTEDMELGVPKDPHEFFDRLQGKPSKKVRDADAPGGAYLAVPETSFVLLHTWHRICIPSWVAGIFSFSDPSYFMGGVHANADLINPSHGYGKKGEAHGGHMTLELQTVQFPTMLQHRQKLIRLHYMLLTEPSTIVYDTKSAQASSLLPYKFFKPW